jgi:hypothetical protein
MIKFLLRILSLLCLCWVGPAQNPNPHQPYHLTWVVIDTSTGEILTQTSKVTPPNVWFPDLTFDLTKLVARAGILKDNFYVCPGHLKGKSNSKQCRGASNYFCTSWSCVSTGNIWWPPPEKTDLITVSKGCFTEQRSHWRPRCDLVKIKFTEKGKADNRWTSVLIWGIRRYEARGPRPGSPIYHPAHTTTSPYSGNRPQ